MRLAAVLLIACACRPAPLTKAGSAFRVAPNPVALVAPVGGSTAVELTLEGDGTFVLQTSEPFSIEGDPVELRPGVPLVRRLTFTPTAVGTVAGELEARSGSSVAGRVSLAGEGVACVADACHTARLDSGSCVQELSPDGTACSSACVVAGRCVAGTCRGNFDACDDGDRCTADTCGATGCVHEPIACPSAGPCRVGRCDSTLGCVTDAAPDGTACGASDCASSRVCISGSCESRPTPDGAPCGEATACQAAATCAAGVCARPPVHQLVPEWSFSASEIEYAGNRDAQGNVYFFECSAGACLLDSLTPSGALRYREPAPAVAALATYNDFVLAGGFVVVAQPDGDLVVAFDAATGHQVWQRHLGDEIVATYVTASCPVPNEVAEETWPLLSDGAGHLVAGFYLGIDPRAGCSGSFVSDDWIVSLDVATGATRWKSSWHNSATNAITGAFDELGNLYVTGNDSLLPTVRSYDPLGQERWSVQYANSDSLLIGGVNQGVLAIADVGNAVRLLDTRTGSVLAEPPIAVSTPAMVISAQPATLFCFAYSVNSPQLTMLRVDLATGAYVTLPVGNAVAGFDAPLLTSRQTLLGAVNGPSGWTLDELALDGGVLSECPLPLGASYGQPSGVAGHWVAKIAGGTQLVSFAIPGLEPADAGWVTARGDVGQEGREP